MMYADALEAFQRHPDYRDCKTVQVLVDLLIQKHYLDPLGIPALSPDADRIRQTLIAALHRDYRPAPSPPSGADGPAAYFTRLIQYAALHSNAKPPVDVQPSAGNEISQLLDSLFHD